MSSTPSRRLPEQERTPEGGALLDSLQGLLEQQLQGIRQGRWAEAAALLAQADLYVQRIAGRALPAGPGSARQWQRIQQLYQELSLALTAQRAEVWAALKAVRRGQRALHTYSSTTVFRR